MECKSFSSNSKKCNCTYEPCERKGYCCQCIEYHKKFGELLAYRQAGLPVSFQVKMKGHMTDL